MTTTIDYGYDPLGRLISADYSSGEFFHYTYDPVGNRLTQETQDALNTYLYDAGNRLVELDGAALEWDVTGNLLRDHTGAGYSYNRQGRLISVDMGGGTFTFTYNGLGDRLQQSVDGATSTYTLDMNAGLTQVLSDGTNAYLYGLGRIGEEQLSGWVYHLPDALGSLRQLADPASTVTLARAYEPFGSPLDAAGLAATSYGFTGEWTDATGLVHLRARYYQPQIGRFFQRDPLRGVQTLPQCMNPYAYGANNPALYTDPSGQFPLLFLAMLAVGTPIITGVTTAAWDLFVSQGVGLGGHNQFRFGCADWSRVRNVGRLAAAGAVNNILSIPLGPLYLIEQLIFGMSPDETNLMVAGWFGLGNEYQALLANPYFQVGQAGGVVGSTAISLFLLSHGIPLRGSSVSQLVAQTGGGGTQIIIAVVQSINESSVIFGGIGVYENIIFAMSSSNVGGSQNQPGSLQEAQRRVSEWPNLEDNLERADARHLRHVREERLAGRSITEGHQREVNSARIGLSKVVERIDNMLHPYHTWQPEAVRYLRQIQTEALNAIELMTDALFGPLH